MHDPKRTYQYIAFNEHMILVMIAATDSLLKRGSLSPAIKRDLNSVRYLLLQTYKHNEDNR